MIGRHFTRKRGELTVWATRDNRSEHDREVGIGKREPKVFIWGEYPTCGGIELTPAKARWVTKMLTKAEEFVR